MVAQMAYKITVQKCITFNLHQVFMLYSDRMAWHIGVALLAYTSGLISMKTLTEFFHREEKKRIVNEEPFFKHSYLRYYTRTLSTGTIEFWAFPVVGEHDGCLSHDYTWELEKYGTGDGFYLGKVTDGEVVKAENFVRSFPLSMQRDALKLFKMAGFYQ